MIERKLARELLAVVNHESYDILEDYINSRIAKVQVNMENGSVDDFLLNKGQLVELRMFKNLKIMVKTEVERSK